MKASKPKYIVTNVRFTPDEFKKLRFFAQAENKSMAQIVREAVSSYLDGSGEKKLSLEELENDPFFKVIGLGESGITDGSEKHDEYIYKLKSQGPDQPRP